MSDLALVEETRRRLLRDLRKVCPEAMEFQPVPGVRTIAESLLHVAAVEFVFAMALALREGRNVAIDLWDEVKAGLATEIGYNPPREALLEHCTDRLTRVRQMACPMLDGESVLLTESDLRGALETLRDRGADLSHYQLQALLSKLSTHLGVGSVGVVLTAHEEYHRGQVLLQNYLWMRTQPIAVSAKL
jgi:hypothetical protein